MAKVLVTGGNGFIGGHLVLALLAEGAEVTCLIRDAARSGRLDPAQVRIVIGDVTDASTLAAAVAGAEQVYHLAGSTMALRSAEMFRVNKTGLQNLLTACAARPSPPTVLSLSSLAASGPTRSGKPRVEADPPTPVSNYGRSKLAGEQVAREFAARLPITILRPPIVFGEGDPYSISVYKPIARWGFHMGQGIGRNRFSMIHAGDLAQAMLLLMRQGQRLPADALTTTTTQGVYFAAADEHPLFGEWGRMIAAAFGRRRLFVWAPPGGYWMWIAAAGSEAISRLRGRPAIFNFDKLREIRSGSWWCSDAALRKDTGFAPAADLRTRIQQTADWYRQQGWA